VNFKIKICGITNAQDAQTAIAQGADAIGLNFYARSLRNVTVSQATSIRNHLDQIANTASRTIVGVFVNSSAADVNQIAREVPLDMIQLHGDESTDIMSQLETTMIIRAIRCGQRSSSEIREEISAWASAGASAVLLDAASGANYGGTGETLDWGPVADIQSEIPIVLAGGLTPQNVAEAIRITGPAAVDVATGVESFPGKKDAGLIGQFVTEAQKAFS
jgi:phosphoribosylanthranilate isomerase